MQKVGFGGVGGGMKKKSRPKSVIKLKNMVLVTCDWSEDGGSRLLRNADKYVKTCAGGVTTPRY